MRVRGGLKAKKGLCVCGLFAKVEGWGKIEIGLCGKLWFTA